MDSVRIETVYNPLCKSRVVRHTSLLPVTCISAAIFGYDVVDATVSSQTSPLLALCSATTLASLRGTPVGRSRLSAAADGDRDLFSAFQFRQLIVEPCAHITDLVPDFDGPLRPQSQSRDDLLGHTT
jgi:hypothetical protein